MKENTTVIGKYQQLTGNRPNATTIKELLQAFLNLDNTILPNLFAAIQSAGPGMPKEYQLMKEGHYKWIALFIKSTNKVLTVEQIKELSQLTLADLLEIYFYNTPSKPNL